MRDTRRVMADGLIAFDDELRRYGRQQALGVEKGDPPDKAQFLIDYLAGHDIALVRRLPGPALTSVTQKPSDLVKVECTQCDASVTLPPVLDAAASVSIDRGQMRVSIPELRDWEFTIGKGWLCPDHVEPEVVAQVPPVVIQCTYVGQPDVVAGWIGGRCPTEVTIEAVVIDHEARYPLGPLEGWEFTLETGWRCPEHIPVAGGANPPEGVKGGAE